MTRASKMLALRVTRNRKHVATAGLPGPHVISAIVSSVVRDAEAKRSWPAGKPYRKRELEFHLGGLLSPERVHVHWADMTLRAGDTVTIEVVQVEDVDPPRGHPKTFAKDIQATRIKNAVLRKSLPKTPAKDIQATRIKNAVLRKSLPKVTRKP